MIDYYFSLHSPWAYLGHETFTALAARHGLAVHYRPVFLPDVFEHTGGLPLAKRHPARQRYRMLELQRWRLKRAVPLILRPAHIPFDPRLPDCLVIALAQAGQNPDPFIKACFETVWVKDGNLGDQTVISDLLTSLGYDADDLIRNARSDTIIAIYNGNARHAIEAGIIGSPCYVRQGEVFWGQDRLELLDDAINSGRPPFLVD
jgi:hypothetical protein